MLKTLILALVAGIALSPAASATTGILGEPAAKASVGASVVSVQQSAAQTCSAATFTITSVMSAVASEEALMQEERKCYLVEVVQGDDGHMYQRWTPIECPPL